MTAQNLARRLLAQEAEHGPRVSGDRVSSDLETRADAAQRTNEKLRLHLSKIIGAAGFRVLLARALTLARADFPWLESVQVQSDGSLAGLTDLAAAARAGNFLVDAAGVVTAEAAAVEGVTAVLAQFLGLLETFIGLDLTVRLVHGIWPEMDNLLHLHVVTPDLHPDHDTGSRGNGRDEQGAGKEQTIG